MKHNYLITGGAGFIGSHFVRYLKEHINPDLRPLPQIVVLDNLTYAGDFSRIKKLIGEDVVFIQGDICDVDRVKALLETYDISCVVNFAAESHVDRSIENQDAFLRTNVNGVQVLLNATRAYWHGAFFNKPNKEEKQKPLKNESGVGRRPRFIQISTDEVYGGTGLETRDLRDENTPLKPSNPYAATKAAADLLIGAFQHTYDYPAMIVRPTNNYGDNQHQEKFIPKIITCLRENKEIPIYGQGAQKRTWLHVEDTCRGLMKIIEDGTIGEIYNIVGKETVSNKHLVEQMVDYYNQVAPIPYTKGLTYVEDRLGHDPYYGVDGRKIERDLGFKPTIALEEGLKRLIEK